jgi:hypothetical protein
MIVHLLTAPVSAPLAGLRFILETIRDMAERELFDEAHIREDLLLLQLRLDEGEIAEAEYLEAESQIMEWLRAARAYREAEARAAREHSSLVAEVMVDEDEQ